MSDKKSCHSQVSDNELITVRWQDEQDGGWREGVVMCVVTNYCAVTSWSVIKRLTGGTSENTAIIYDRHRHERAIVTLSKVQIVEPRCDACNGDGEITSELLGYKEKFVCNTCHGSGKRA